MSMTDPIADLLTRIRNGQSARKTEVTVASSKLKTAILKVLKDEGYIADFGLNQDDGKPVLTIGPEVLRGPPVIDRIERVSRPGAAHLSRQGRDSAGAGRHGYGIVSTPKGVMTDKAAHAIGQGGEVLCIVA